MRRKSERNKAKGSPEKKVEKATRKSTRRRGRRANSSSPERGDDDNNQTDKAVEVAKVEDVEVRESTAPTTRLKIKEIKSVIDEESSKASKSANSPAPAETIVSGDVKNQTDEDGASVWKVARADASPGEIQKLKLCRQRHPSEASDSSSSRKKSQKSYESGEGDGEEGDSGEELPKSIVSVEGKTETQKDKDKDKTDFGSDDISRDDPSSSSNTGQDSKEEVSHCNREILPRTTITSSAPTDNNNFLLLSDDKKKLDNDGDDATAIPENVSAVVDKQNLESDKDKDNTDKKIEDSSQDKDNVEKDEEGRKEEAEEPQAVVQPEVQQEGDKPLDKEEDKPEEKTEDKPETKESSSEEERRVVIAENQVSEAKAQAKLRTSARTLRRKHRNKYHDSSDSESAESEEEVPEVIKKIEEDSKEKDEDSKEKIRSRSPSADNRLEFDQKEESEKEDKKSEIDERISSSRDEVVQAVKIPPVKVNLKRSFSARVAEIEEVKKDDTEKNGEAETPTQVKENHEVVEETGEKNVPRKRRWGTSVTTQAAVVPEFTVSTDSLKALVPGAKPLSITEVKLSKDDDEEKSKRREREKLYSISEDHREEKIREDGTAVKSEREKRGDLKHDNHIGAKRKISILKETPRIKSPSPTSAKATNVLLIKNLVRPFTLTQIKELLSRTGTIMENGFWIDGIKSKCYVMYANEDQGFETRQALHGISWPVSNPKRLHVEYATKEDMDAARESSKDQQPPVRKTEPLVGGDTWQQVWTRDEKPNAAAKVTTVREWDLGKEDGNQIKEKEREKKDLDNKKRRQRSRSPPIEPHLPPPARKFKKKEDDPPPAKLLDDLFKKTRAIPCIYWLPLTNEQIVVKEEMRRQHMAEHARRLEEMKRAERSRDPASRRRRSPRK